LDNEPGNAVWGQQHPYIDNTITYMKVSKADLLLTGIDENKAHLNNVDVSQNYPNPVSSTTEIKVNLNNSVNLNLEIVNLVGQKVFENRMIDGKPGVNTLAIDVSNFEPGVYFYTVKVGSSSVTKKMIVE